MKKINFQDLLKYHNNNNKMDLINNKIILKTINFLNNNQKK